MSGTSADRHQTAAQTSQSAALLKEEQELRDQLHANEAALLNVRVIRVTLFIDEVRAQLRGPLLPSALLRRLQREARDFLNVAGLGRHGRPRGRLEALAGDINHQLALALAVERLQELERQVTYLRPVAEADPVERIISLLNFLQAAILDVDSDEVQQAAGLTDLEPYQTEISELIRARLAHLESIAAHDRPALGEYAALVLEAANLPKLGVTPPPLHPDFMYWMLDVDMVAYIGDYVGSPWESLRDTHGSRTEALRLVAGAALEEAAIGLHVRAAMQADLILLFAKALIREGWEPATDVAGILGPTYLPLIQLAAHHRLPFGNLPDPS